MRICRHCRVRVEQMQFNGGLAWMHVVSRRHGGHDHVDAYRVCKMTFVAEPMGSHE